MSSLAMRSEAGPSLLRAGEHRSMLRRALSGIRIKFHRQPSLLASVRRAAPRKPYPRLGTAATAFCAVSIY